MADDLYHRDFVEWSETQAALLRRLGAGERVNAEVDWLHLVEEVGDLGVAEIRAVKSLLRQAMVHLIKIHAGADRPSQHWRGEVVGFLADAAAGFTPSMRQRIDLEGLYANASKQVRAAGGRVAVPDRCPWSLDELLDERSTIDALLARL